jgi:hypothetical protein
VPQRAHGQAGLSGDGTHGRSGEAVLDDDAPDRPGDVVPALVRIDMTRHGRSLALLAIRPY